MEEILDIFSNREIAAALWISLFLLWSNWKTSSRKAFRQFLQTLFNWKIVIPIILITCYFVSGVYLLALVELWDSSLLKDTVFWLFGGAFMLAFKMTNVKSESQFYAKTIRTLLEFTIVFEFIVSFYSFSFITEVVLLPVLTVIVLINEVAKRKEDESYKKVHSFLNLILAIFGLSLLFYSILHIAAERDVFFSWATLKTFILPIILTLLYLPCLYVFTLWMRYEELFVRLDFLLEGKKSKRVAKLRVLRLANFSLSRLHNLSKKTGRLYRSCSLDYVYETLKLE